MAAARGYVTFAMSHRLSGEAKLTAPIHDCNAAFADMR